MYMQEALEKVCAKRKLSNPNDYALLLNDKGNTILIPLDRTVASLQGKTELLLVKRSMLPQMDAVIRRGVGRTTDPNGAQYEVFYFPPFVNASFCTASIFKTMTETPEQQFSSAMDFTAAYKVRAIDPALFWNMLMQSLQKYTIYRKVPMLVTRQERTLAIDGAYIHVRALRSFAIKHLFNKILFLQRLCHLRTKLG